jgi:hypothetical protein
MMSEIFSWMLFVMTTGFIFYWLLSFVFLKLGFYFNVGDLAVEFFRIWLKPLFLINLLWFLIIEIVFSLVYWTSFALLKIIPFLTPAILFVNSLHSENPGSMSWLFYSLVIFCVVMTPYFFLQFKLSFYFKRTIFTKLASSLNAKNSKFLGQSANIVLDQNLYTRLAAKDQKIMEWVEKSLQDFSSSKGNEDKRFSIKMTGTDHMSWEINNINAHFFEGLIEFHGIEKFYDRHGKTQYKLVLNKKLFDGIVIFVENILKDSWSPTIFETEQIFADNEPKNRKIHNSSFFTKLYSNLVFKSMASKTGAAYDDTNLQQYVLPEILKIKTNSLFQYIICDNQNLYMLVHTDLENTAFDLNMNIPVKNSIEYFEHDLELVKNAIGEIELILKVIEEKEYFFNN